mmetsp:Transcript_20978/g.34670  ORF Transcript_20978/g.34670 Transcript_20978/m.34670 type:complete len:986 (-) Transcript_20978:819-3776(-)|eukprot:CAMPEP_0119008366 /NCGR_PEP_ID=MMETSP1176-20130426/3641_1 /TAXON_ID=265551 /ORGANISM="Synedropsis recta cf, Strain CCMP1620" /LENGTH=985 /DNA_ID=CAMNT_0006960681 /DNA_START=101 /DNA_END=3058 /DNA_ORIENTATION=+
MPPNNKSNNTSTMLDDEDVKRIAMRIAMTASAKLQSQKEVLSDADLMRQYILMCPYLDPNSPAIEAALLGLLVQNDDNENDNNKLPQTDTIISSSSTLDDKASTAAAAAAATDRGVTFDKSKKKKKKRGTFGKVFCVFGYILRTLILDFPLALFIAAYFAAVWTHRLHDWYLRPQLEALYWDSERMYQEETYYKRYCEAEDQSTRKGSDLFLPINATTQEAYDHQLIHGLTVFPSVLSDKTATELRDFVISQNFKLPEDESIFVIANKHRYSFGLGTEEPTVATAMEELASNERLKPALEKIMGPNPALIEMTCITSTPGAKDQYWHDDVVARASAMQFGRSFGPSYSIFIQLQNTTKKMGATAACPGTHFCAAGSMETFCDKQGFQVVGEDGYWRTGDAMLMNMNIYHRGAAHKDPDAEDRVMLILTFVPRPRSHAESRQMSQGITFSLRWDMWGHTLDDLAHAKTRMTQPWTTLRSLGLYKQKDAQWGIDYISGGSMRMANGDNGFRDDQLEEQIEAGGFPLLPSFLNGEVDTEKEGWRQYYLKTCIKIEEFTFRVNLVAVPSYILLQLIILVVRLFLPSDDKNGPFRRFGWAIARLVFVYGLAYGLFKAAVHHVDNTQWARDISGGRRYTNSFVITDNDYSGPTTYPHREDVLIETRYKSPAFAMYNDFIMAHPGNRPWKVLLDSTAPLYESYSGLPKIFREQLPEYMVSSMESQQRRFLYQGKKSHWQLMSREDALDYNERQLQISSSPVLRRVYTGLEYLLQDCKHGHLRDTVLVRYDVIPFLMSLQHKLLTRFDNETFVSLAHLPDTEDMDNVEPAPKLINILHRSLTLTKPECKSRFVRRPVKLAVGTSPGEPEAGAWIREGSIVEARHRGDSGQYKWYHATVDHIASTGYHAVNFYDGQEDLVKADGVRAYIPFTVGEKVELNTDEVYIKTEVIRVRDNMLDLKELKSGKVVKNIFMGDVRRPNTKTIKKKRETKYY